MGGIINIDKIFKETWVHPMFFYYFCDQLTLKVLYYCHSERSEESRKHLLYASEILPPFGRLNDNKIKLNNNKK